MIDAVPAPGTLVAWLIIYGKHAQDRMVILADQAKAANTAAAMHGIKVPLVVGEEMPFEVPLAKEWFAR